MRIIPAAVLALASMMPVEAALAEDQLLRIVVPYPAGGVGDATARMIAESMRTNLNRPVMVDNKVGAAGRLGVQAVKDAPADGNVLLFTPIAPMAIFPHVYEKLGYDPVADFVPLSQVATFDLAVAVGPQAPAKSIAELVAWLQANPAHATYGSPAAGSLPHFFAVQFAGITGIDFRHVAYKGNPQAIADLIGGHLPVFFTSTQDLVETHQSGRLRVLATSGAQRSTALPEVPTFAEAGYHLRGEGWYGIYAPAKTPASTIARLNGAIVAAVQEPHNKARLVKLGVHPTGTTSAEFVAIQKADIEFWGPVIKASGFKPE